MIVDTHAHLDMVDFSGDLEEVVGRADRAGVTRMVTIGIDIASSRAAAALAERFSAVWASAGVHPHDAAAWDQESRKRLLEILEQPKVVAVGETGLDYYRRRVPEAVQMKAFRDQLEIALEKDLPIIIHAREAHSQVLDVLQSAHRRLKGVMHCFSGSLEEARPFLDLGLKISIAGPITYPSAEKTRRLVAALPVESFVVETDCPFLPPHGRRGERNEPALVTETAGKMAEITELSIEDVSRVTTANARELFGLGLEPPAGAIAYRIRRSLYLNITNQCQNNCTFCGRTSHHRVKGHDLRLLREPSSRELLEAVAKERDFDEVVFCGYGEPLLRLDTVVEVARALKPRGHRIRVNTNGLASLRYRRPVLEELAGLVDAYSVSLNAPDEKTYERLCRPGTGPRSFQAVLDFISEARARAEVTVTVVDIPGVDLEACRRLAESLGVRFRVRHLNEVG